MSISPITFDKIPLPPTSNHQYISFVRRGRIIHAPSKDLVNFKRQMQEYWLTQGDTLKFTRELFSGYPLKVHVDLYFERSRILSKRGSFKRLDVSNRIKALHDSLADALLIDDCMFVRISAEKHGVQKISDEGCSVRIEVTEYCELQ